MTDAEEGSERGSASKWVFFFVGCMATIALIYLLVDQRDKAGFGDAVFHTIGAMVTSFGVFGVMRWLEHRKGQRRNPGP